MDTTNEKVNELQDSGERTEFETGSVRDSMKGKGFPRIRRSSKGDQLVKIQVETPKKLSSSLKKIMKELSSADGKVQNQFQKMKF